LFTNAFSINPGLHKPFWLIAVYFFVGCLFWVVGHCVVFSLFVFVLVVVVGFLCAFVFVGLFFWVGGCFGLVFGVCLVVVVDVAYRGTTITNC
jgi:hypothetical protein